MSFARFHPLVQRWFTAGVGEPTSAQRRGWESIRDGRHTLIAAPTGSGKTLAAFLSALDDLLQEGLTHSLPDEVRVLYISPLKALSADIHRNLAVPRAEIRRLAAEAGFQAPRITAAVRTGDTTGSERAAMIRTPPHILVTTPESLYLLLTSERSRQMLRTVRTVIVDEIHAVIGTRRGAHVALSLERLQHVAERPVLRLGLSATQRPLSAVAKYLVGSDGGGCTIVDDGHRREMDLQVDMPRSPLDAVMSHEVWQDYYDRLAQLVQAHRTTLIFVNTRRLAERVTRHLCERLGEAAVTAHHGSLSKEKRLDAETRLKNGQLRALVATASLELGIDIGHVDLVCQIGSPRRIATLLQRVGRSGHTIAGMPKGRLFPVSRDDLIECAALLRCVRRGELDAVVEHDAPLDVLAQQIVAETACRACSEDDLFALVRRAWPYRELARREFNAVLRMTAEGFSTRRGRRAALVHRDEINHVVRGRRGSRLLAQTSGGAIPEVADYRVVLEPDETFIGTLNEDFAIESMAGDIFQLGNASWQVLQVGAGTVRVADARGAPPTIPFWVGEAPARSDELSRAVSDLRADIERTPAVEFLIAEVGLSEEAARQALDYVLEGRRALGAVPTQGTLVLERFFDESGGMQLVLHAPFGNRINKAWGLALRKRFCRQFNFELQAAATDDALLMSLGPQHSFPLSDVFRYLHPETVRDVLVQAFLDAPVFQTRWRWNSTVSLAVPRRRGGRKVPPQVQRMLADDLLAAVFPDAAACLENIPGDRQIPDHPLVSQTVRDCLQEAMDVEGLCGVLRRVHSGAVQLIARDTPEPSTFACEILNAKPYAFLDDAPLEERRTHAVQSRRAGEPSSAGDVGALDGAAIDRVRGEARPDPRDADELHDVLMAAGFLTAADAGASEHPLFEQLAQARRACEASVPSAEQAQQALWIAAERVPELLAIHPDARLQPQVEAPASRARAWERDEAIVELLRSRLTILGPTTAPALAGSLAVAHADADAALLALETEGVVLRGRFTPGVRELEWSDRALLSRIHRYTIRRLRAEIAPVSAADFMRFLFSWQHVEPSSRLREVDGLREIVAKLDGFEVAAGAWERSVLPARLDGYDPAMLDMLCLAGEVGWSRLSMPALEPANPPRLVPATPVALYLREHAGAWTSLRSVDHAALEGALSASARRVLEALRTRGASFFNDLRECAADVHELRDAIGALVACGLAASDGFSGLRALVRAARGSTSPLDRRAHFSGRWHALGFDRGQTGVRPGFDRGQTGVRPGFDRGQTRVRPGFDRGQTRVRPGSDRGSTGVRPGSDHLCSPEWIVELHAWALLRRYGVIFPRLLTREINTVPWRDLTRAYRRLEARGEIRGGRFVAGMPGEQFALPGAVERLREIRRSPSSGREIAISASDPLNLTGIVTPGERLRAIGRHRVVYRDGVPIGRNAVSLSA